MIFLKRFIWRSSLHINLPTDGCGFDSLVNVYFVIFSEPGWMSGELMP